MADKPKGSSSSRGRANKKRDMPQAENSPLIVDLESEMAFQQATQAIADRYEKQIKQLREHHSKEMNSVLLGLSDELTAKPTLWARITGRYKDIFIVFNHNTPVWCPKKECPTRREGINWGIEAVTIDLSVAFDHIRAYMERNADNPYAHAKLLHLQVDRRKGSGAVVDEMSWSWAMWRNSDHYDDQRRIKAKMVDLVVKSSR